MDEATQWQLAMTALFAAGWEGGIVDKIAPFMDMIEQEHEALRTENAALREVLEAASALVHSANADRWSHPITIGADEWGALGEAIRQAQEQAPRDGGD